MPRNADPAIEAHLRNMPPTDLLPKQLAQAVTDYNLARTAYDVARTEAIHFEQTSLPHAKEEDVIALADAMEKGKGAPAPKAEVKALEQLDALRRDVAAKEVMEDRARLRVDDALSATHAEIVVDAGKRVEKARAEVSELITELEAALSTLGLVEGLSSWAAEPRRAFRVRGITAPIPRSGDDAPGIDLVLAGLRGVVVPPEQKPVVPVIEEQPEYVCPHCSGPHPLVDCTGDPELETKRPPLPTLPTAA